MPCAVLSVSSAAHNPWAIKQDRSETESREVLTNTLVQEQQLVWTFSVHARVLEVC